MVNKIIIGKNSWLSYLMLYLTLKQKFAMSFLENHIQTGVVSRAGFTNLQEIDAVMLKKGKVKLIEAKHVENRNCCSIKRKQITNYLDVAKKLKLNCEVWGFVRFKAFKKIVGVKIKEPKTHQIFICSFEGIAKYNPSVKGVAEAVKLAQIVIDEKEMVDYIQKICGESEMNSKQQQSI